jgi:hypothetical protein
MSSPAPIAAAAATTKRPCTAHIYSFYSAGAQGRLVHDYPPPRVITFESDEAALDSALAAADADAASSKRPTEGKTNDEAEPRKKIKIDLLVQMKEEAVVAAKWFSKFCYTRYMVETLGMTPAFDGDEDLPAELYKEYRERTERRHKQWKEWTEVNNVRDAAVKCFDEPEPPKVMSVWAWNFMEGPLACENEFIEPFSAETLKNIVVANKGPEATTMFLSVSAYETGVADHVAEVEAVLINEHQAAEASHDYHPAGMLLCGVVMRSNAKWLSDKDLTKIARAHGSVSLTREDMLNDIYRSQILHCQEIIAAGIDMGEEARGYCGARGVIEDSKKALGLLVLRDERPNFRDRSTGRIPHSTKGLEGIYCAQCDRAFDEKDSEVKDAYPQHLLDSVCTACSTLPIA